MSMRKQLSNPAFKEESSVERNEEWNNFMQRIGQVSSLVKDMASGDKARADAAKTLADKYLDGKVVVDDGVEMKIKSNRTVINKAAFNSFDKDAGERDKESWMAEVSKDAEKRAADRKIRREKADTLKTQATKAFRRGEYEKALSYYNKAIEQIRDNPMLYCDRALTNIKLGNYEKVFDDCHWAQRLNENSFKARLYTAKAHKELDQMEKLVDCRKELNEMFPQHLDLINYFLDKKEGVYEESDVNESENVVEF